MSTIRFFSGGREARGKRSIAAEIMRIEVQKKGKMPSADRFKYIFKQRLAESRKKALGGKTVGFKLPGSLQQARKMSKNAEQALKEIAQKKAAKEAKAMRNMVFVRPRTFSNGSIVRDGKIFDIAGNTIARVNTKNGKIVATGLGGTIGRYKARSRQTDALIQGAIDKYSPYYINLRKMQAMQQGSDGGVWGSSAGHDVINIYGRSPVVNDHAAHNNFLSQGESGVYGEFSSDQAGPRQNVGATSWGAMSDNVWGTYTDNIWGTSTDTVWGTNTSDIWGGIGGNPWGNFAKTHRIWGSGDGHNYLKGLAAKVAVFFGLHFKSQASRAAFHEAVSSIRSTRADAHEHGQTTRSSSAHDAHEHVQTTRASAHEAHEHVTTRAPVITTRK